MWNLKKKKEIFLDIIIILCWMGIVFTFSSQVGKTSSGLSRTIASKVVDISHKDGEITAKERTTLINKYNYTIRKMAHYTIYLIGGITIISFIRILTNKKWLASLLTIVIGFIYASSDELHQYFVSGRDARFTDVLIDTAGVITGVVLYLGVIIIINKIRNSKNKHDEESIK